MFRKFAIHFQLLSAMFFLPVFLGCENSQEATVTGIVTLDGTPLERGAVHFSAGNQNDSRAAEGSILPDGTYKVQIGQSGKLYIGEYLVEVVSRKPAIPNPEGGPPTPGDLITPDRYRDIQTSGLRYNIRAGENTIDIVLVSDPVETPAEQAALDSGDPTAEGSSEQAEEVPAEEPVEVSTDKQPEVTKPEALGK